VKRVPAVILALGLAFADAAPAAIPTGKVSLADRLATVRSQVIDLEQTLLGSLRSNSEAKGNVKRIQTLISLQRTERELGAARIRELERTIQELESRRGILRERVSVEQAVVRRALSELHSFAKPLPKNPELIESERIEQPRAKALRNLVQMGLREIEALKVDLQDADQLEGRIAEERGQLEATVHEMAESEGILELNKKLQLDVISRTHRDRLSQLEKYRKLKTAEAQVSDLIRNFNARIELQDARRDERQASRVSIVMANAEFAKQKGKLRLPIPGRIVSQFGKAFDPTSHLTVFKKGIDILAENAGPVRAVYSGKIAYSGELPNYGRMLIVDHGDHFYTICANLGELKKKVGDPVAMGEEIGAADPSGTPVYFEIRARNLPVNPLQWVAN